MLNVGTQASRQDGVVIDASIVALEHVVADHYIVESQVSLWLPISKAWVQAPAARLPSVPTWMQRRQVA